MDHPQPTADDEDDQLDHHHHHHHHQQQQQQSRESQPPSPSSSTSSSPSKKQHSQSHFRREPSFSRWCGDDDNGSKIHQLHLQPVPTTYAYGLGHTPTNSFDGAISIPDSDPDPDPFSLCYPSDDNDVIADHDHDHHYDSSAHHRGGHYFRQRSPANDSRVAFDIESGTASATLHTSQSRAKLDSLENSSLSPLHLAPLSPSSDAGAVFKTALCIFIWYTISTCLTLYNKSLLGDKLGKFPAPLLMNTFHFAMQAVLSRVIGCFQVPRSTETSVPMTWRDYFVKVVPTAIGTALDVNLSNASLVFITVTFATMCKSASPIFLLLFAFAFRLESPSIKLLGIILVISVGVLLTVSRETDFDFWGFVFVMLAAVMSGFRWSMTQILLQKEAYGLKNPITLMSYIAPVMTLMTASLSLLLDPWHEFHNNVYFNNLWHTMRSCLLMLIGGSLAFFMVLTEYILVSATSAVTVTIAGVVKEAVTILVAVFYFHEQFTLLKGVGLITIMIGVSLFNWYKYHKQKKGQLNEHGEPMSPSASMTTKYVILDETDSQEDDT